MREARGLDLHGGAVRARPMKAPRIFLIAATLCPLAGCGSSTPVLMNGSAEGVVVRYNQSGATSTDATAAAEKYCAQYGRKAAQGGANAATGDTFVSYTCQKP